MKKAPYLFLVAVLLSGIASASRVVRDEFDREIKVPDLPHRLICLAPSITDTVYALGRGDDIAGVTDFTKYPAEAIQKPSVGAIISPSLEKIVSLKPDLVLAIGDLNNFDVVRSIERLGFPVFVINPRGVEGIYRAIESIGKAIHQETASAALVARLQIGRASCRERL